jgi:hypothetical protein
MTRNVILHLDEFGQEALERLLEDERTSPETALRTAARYYLSHRDQHRRAWRARRFRPGPGPSSDLRVAYDDEIWSELEEEALRQRVTPEELAVHSLMYLLADYDSGRLGARLEDGPGDG